MYAFAFTIGIILREQGAATNHIVIPPLSGVITAANYYDYYISKFIPLEHTFS